MAGGFTELGHDTQPRSQLSPHPGKKGLKTLACEAAPLKSPERALACRDLLPQLLKQIMVPRNLARKNNEI